MKILVTGGAGYIGSHTCVELLNNNYELVILDNFSNSNRDVLESIKKITNKDFTFYEGDMIDKNLLQTIFKENEIDAVIDFAAFKAVGESVSKPVAYYQNNVSTILNLLTIMQEYDIKKLVFSSSATVYGNPASVPITEDFPTGNTTNPYGTSKLMVEQILKDLYNSDNSWDIAILRYFNPVGAHESGLIGEAPVGKPNNLMPFITKVAKGELPKLMVFGNDYNTVDGTGVRDYIHVVDLAIGHIKALEKLNKENQGLFIYNLGTGTGYSVLQLIKTFERVNNIKINYEITDRRPGDIDSCYSDPLKSKNELNFQTKKSLDDMCKDAWNFEKNYHK
ncbi:MAG: UDP-glucose 4-epimerase GalE [Bacilli bacterium]|nr:UDP-glucose 4-epimerase GalE [Bacilli bacterium]